MLVTRDFLTHLNVALWQGESDSINAALTSHEPVVDQLSAQRCDIFVGLPQEGVDLFFRIVAGWIESQQQVLQDDHSLFTLCRNLLEARSVKEVADRLRSLSRFRIVTGRG